MRMFGQPTLLEDAEALDRAADMARNDGDLEHERRLREAALFKRSLAEIDRLRNALYEITFDGQIWRAQRIAR